jgi:hypothetical protein
MYSNPGIKDTILPVQKAKAVRPLFYPRVDFSITPLAPLTRNHPSSSQTCGMLKVLFLFDSEVSHTAHLVLGQFCMIPSCTQSRRRQPSHCYTPPHQRHSPTPCLGSALGSSRQSLLHAQRVCWWQLRIHKRRPVPPPTVSRLRRLTKPRNPMHHLPQG